MKKDMKSFVRNLKSSSKIKEERWHLSLELQQWDRRMSPEYLHFLQWSGKRVTDGGFVRLSERGRGIMGEEERGYFRGGSYPREWPKDLLYGAKWKRGGRRQFAGIYWFLHTYLKLNEDIIDHTCTHMLQFLFI